MPAKKIISILALSAMFALPAEIAAADTVKVNNGNTRVTIQNGNVRVQTRDKKETYIPYKKGGYSTNRSRWNRLYRNRWSRRYRNRPYKRNYNCSYQRSTSRSSSGSRTVYRSSTTNNCK